MGFLKFFKGPFNSGLFIGRKLISVIFQLLFRLEDQAVGVIELLDPLLGLLVLLLVRLGLLLHLLDLLFGQTRRSFDTDALFFAGALIAGRYVKYPVGVDIERHLDLRNSPRGRRYTVQVEPADGFVIL